MLHILVSALLFFLIVGTIWANFKNNSLKTYRFRYIFLLYNIHLVNIRKRVFWMAKCSHILQFLMCDVSSNEVFAQSAVVFESSVTWACILVQNIPLFIAYNHLAPKYKETIRIGHCTYYGLWPIWNKSLPFQEITECQDNCRLSTKLWIVVICHDNCRIL